MSEEVIVKGYKLGSKISGSGVRMRYRGIRLDDGQESVITVIAVRSGRSLNMILKRAEQSKLLKFPGLVVVLDCGVLSGNRFYYTQKDDMATPIKDKILEIKSPEERLFATAKFTIELLEVLDCIHHAKATHRDLATSHVYINCEDQVLLDGFIHDHPKFESPSTINIVNLPYVSPEQLTGCATGRKTDIYSAGIILYELVVGAVPYMSNYSKIEDVRKGVIPSPVMNKTEVSLGMERIIMKALAPRNSRYLNVRRFIKDLEDFHASRSFLLKFKDLSRKVKRFFAM